jgi:SAM-dependent methyltransferase
MPSEHGVHAGYDVVACTRCGFAFANDTPEQRFLDAYYREMAKKSALLERRGYTEPEYLVRTHRVSLTHILPHVHPGDRVLDIGCYTGNLLALLRDAVPGVRVTGLDPSALAARVAREHHGVSVEVGSLFDELDLGEFDVVLLTHVLEHIVELRPFLARILTLMADGARLCVEVPDAEAFFLTAEQDDPIGVEHKDPFLQFSVEHVNYFTAASLTNLMRANGFAPLGVTAGVSTVAMLASAWVRAPFVADAGGPAALRRYVEDCRALMEPLVAVIDDLAERRLPVVVWGAGAHTQRLLASGALDRVEIRFFVDSDPGYHGATLAGVPIRAPEALRDDPHATVLISSQMYEDEIERQIRAAGYPNPVVTLYRRAPAGTAAG